MLIDVIGDLYTVDAAVEIDIENDGIGRIVVQLVHGLFIIIGYARHGKIGIIEIHGNIFRYNRLVFDDKDFQFAHTNSLTGVCSAILYRAICISTQAPLSL